MTGNKQKTIAIITSGGDAPGMNACIRALTRTALANGMRVIGFEHGFTGILNRQFRELHSRSVSNIIQRGGTILGSARCAEFMEPEGRELAAKNLTDVGVDILFVIGGNGSLRGAHQLMKTWSGQIIGLPGTIDNDLAGTDYTIGYFTALDTALDAIDKIRDTADAFDRIFLIEVMGREAGFIAQMVGIASGAEDILIPEEKTTLKQISNRLIKAKKTGKQSYIIVVAEGAFEGGAVVLAEKLSKTSGFPCHACVLGHIQRGGSPAISDRILATKLGAFAVEAAMEGANGVMCGEVNNKLVLTLFKETWRLKKTLDPFLLRVNEIVAH